MANRLRLHAWLARENQYQFQYQILRPRRLMVTAGLAAWLGPGWAVTVDGLVVFAGGLAILAWRPQVAWLGCAAPPRRVWRS